MPPANQGDLKLAELAKEAGLQFSGGFLEFPPSISRVKIDVGLSWDAVQTSQWLAADEHLAVIGVEPIPSNVASVKEIISRSQDLSSRLLLLPIALADARGMRDFFVTNGDKGSSSLYMPLRHEWQEKISVPTFTLEEVLELIDPMRFPRVDYLKTDCQGSDLDIIRGARQSLKRIAIVTVEAENRAYKGTHNSESDLDDYFSSSGFERLNPRSHIRRVIGDLLSPFNIVHRIYGSLKNVGLGVSHPEPNVSVEDPTYLNQLYVGEYRRGEITAYQRG